MEGAGGSCLSRYACRKMTAAKVAFVRFVWGDKAKTSISLPDTQTNGLALDPALSITHIAIDASE